MTRVAIMILVLLPILLRAAPGYGRDVLPILSDNCYRCHGPDAKAREAKLRLDQKEGALRVKDPVVLPGNSAESELIARINSDDPEERMPPPDSNLNLTAAQKETLKLWIEDGAKWGKHWAYEPPKKLKLPQPKNAKWARNEIDLFIARRLEAEGLKTSVPADKITWLRRVSLDLTGLPPTLVEVEAFLKDESTQAFEMVVDRLLASPRYGERMAWDWLEAARYADSNGYQGDRERTMWPWRDWVVRTLNANMPYDQFTIEQLAGDLLPNATEEQVLATGFNRNHMINGEGGRIAEENRVDYIFDQMETMATLWMGATMICARCHDHKFDPFIRRDYYSLFAFYNNTPVNGGGGDPQMAPNLPIGSPEQSRQIVVLEEQIATQEKQIRQRQEELRTTQAAWEKQMLAKGGTIASGTVASSPLITVKSGPVKLEANIRGATQIHLAVTGAGDGLSCDWADWAEPVLLDAQGKATKLTSIKWQSATAGWGKTLVGKNAQGEALRIAGKPVTDGIGTHADSLISYALPKGHAFVKFKARVGLDNGGADQAKVLGPDTRATVQFHVFTKKPNLAALAKGNGKDELKVALRMPGEKRSKVQRDKVAQAHWGSDGTYNTLVGKRDASRKKTQNIQKSFPKVMVMKEMDKPRETKVLVRGLYNQPSTTVPINTPTSLPPLAKDAPRNRLGLANWLMDKRHPLAARVTVNRIWQQFFGVGLVKTAEDFGVQGEKPSHPELLDWLAVEFLEGGWDVKAMHKRIVLSATYRQSSAVTPALYERDPGNRLLSRMPRYRLPSWMIRDQALFVSGLLVEKRGGPSVKPYQPAGIWSEATFGKKKYTPDKGEALHRRSLYTFWRRIVGPTMFFDEARRQTCEVRRSRTNTPLHALITLNDTTYVEAARAMAQRVLKEGGKDDGARVAHAFRLATSRLPKPRERDLLVRRVGQLRDSYAKDEAAAKALLKVGEFKGDPSLDTTDRAAYTVLCSLILNLDEVITHE